MKEISMSAVRSQLAALDAMPCAPAILLPVLRHLSEPSEKINVPRIIELVAHDKSLAAQTLRMANSPLFGLSSPVDSVRAAVMTLGLERMRTIATTCCVLRLIPSGGARLDPRVFWEHSLGCALVARKLARRVGYADPEKAYLAGLLHDIGFVVNMMFFPEQFRKMMQRATREMVALEEMEETVFGFDHGSVGELLAARWLLGDDLQEVIRHHHQCHGRSSIVLSWAWSPSLTCCAGRADSDTGTMNCSSSICKRIPFAKTIAGDLPGFSNFEWQSFLTELQAYAKQVRNLVSVLYRTG